MGGSRQAARLALRGVVAPAVVLLWLVRRWLRVELVLPNVTLFGHLALEPEKYLAARARAPRRRPRVLSVWSFGRRRDRANHALARIWARRVVALPSPVVDAMHRVAGGLPRYSMPVATLDKLHENDDVIDDGGSFLRPSPSEEDALGRFLDDRGIDGARPWVCFVVRDARFAPVGSGPHASGPLRSRSFEDFIPAALALADRGIPVLKIGSPGTLDVAGLHPRLFDYANDPAKDPILDVMLPARATTVVSTMSGPDAVALAAHRPVLYVDLAQYSLCFAGTALTTWIPARLRDREGRMLSLREVFDCGAGRALGEGSLERLGIAVERSTPEEIVRSVTGHVDRVLTTRGGTPRVESMQDRYRLLFRELLARDSVAPLGALRSRLDDDFLDRFGDDFLA